MSFLDPEPIDPFYGRFRDGFTKWIIEKPQYPGLRWASWSKGGEWDEFKLAEWDFIDFGVIGPRSPLMVELNTNTWQPVWRWENFKSERDLPPIWGEVNNVYARYKTVRSQVVWNPYDGSWREMRRRSSAPGGTGPDHNQAEFERKARQLYQEYRAGIITDDIYKKALADLVAEYF